MNSRQNHDWSKPRLLVLICTNQLKRHQLGRVPIFAVALTAPQSLLSHNQCACGGSSRIDGACFNGCLGSQAWHVGLPPLTVQTPFDCSWSSFAQGLRMPACKWCIEVHDGRSRACQACMSRPKVPLQRELAGTVSPHTSIPHALEQPIMSQGSSSS